MSVHHAVDPRPPAGGELPVVVVVEHDRAVNDAVCEALLPTCRVYGALDVEEGLRLARDLRPHLIVCDPMAPGRAGEDVLRAIRAEPRFEAVPVLVLAERADSDGHLDGLGAVGTSDYLLKPFLQPELVARATNLLRLGQLREHARALDTAKERDRIARDLHDLVIQRLFAAGMHLSALLPEVGDEAAPRLREVVDELDRVIKDIRTTIFDLQAEEKATSGLRAGVQQMAADAAERLGFSPRLHLEGAIDTIGDEEAAAQLLVALREALSNVIRHARAASVEVDVVATAGGDLVLRVGDDGVGPSPGAQARTGFGLRNMASRAASLGGTFTIGSRRPHGTEIEWRVPLAAARRG